MITFITVSFILQCVGIILGVLRLAYPDLNIKPAPGSIAFGIAVGSGFAVWAGLILLGVIV